MKITPETTVAELMKEFPEGFSIGPGTVENPGALSRIIAASSHLRDIVQKHPFATGNQGYLVVEMID